VDETFLERPDFEGGKYVYTPPPRAKENQEHLWHAVATDILSVVSTDHCPSVGRAEVDRATTSRRFPTEDRGSRTGCT
jgi:dihydroorotase-like cyclic amidohydrolase